MESGVGRVAATGAVAISGASRSGGAVWGRVGRAAECSSRMRGGGVGWTQAVTSNIVFFIPRRSAALCISLFALVQKDRGQWEEAEKLFMQVMETRKTKLGADHPSTLTSMANLAFTWKHQGRHADALALMKDCAQARQRVLGAKHPYTLSSLAIIANWSG